jgi:hypothetical protein
MEWIIPDRQALLGPFSLGVFPGYILNHRRIVPSAATNSEPATGLGRFPKLAAIRRVRSRRLHGRSTPGLPGCCGGTHAGRWNWIAR